MPAKDRGRIEVSIVIPVANGDKEWLALAQDLTIVPKNWEIVFCGEEPAGRTERQVLDYLRRYVAVHWQHSSRSRAAKLNEGAAAAQGQVLWFVHADSRVDHRCLAAIEQQLPQIAGKMLFFRLAFLNDGPALTRINQFGAWFRSEILKIPFGDQGLCLQKSLWQSLRGFPENVPHGEDHLFVWRAHHGGVALRALPATLYSSARKYRDRGWRHTTGSHLKITYQQALPQLKTLLAAYSQRLKHLLITKVYHLKARLRPETHKPHTTLVGATADATKRPKLAEQPLATPAPHREGDLPGHRNADDPAI